jgi:hypothetical protein
MITSTIPTNTQEEKVVIEAIQGFIQGADERDQSRLEQVLHPEFRVVANRLMGSNTLRIIDRSLYLQLIKEGKLGGDQRTVEIGYVHIVENNATARVKIKGKALTFQSLYHLVKTETGTWQLIEDLPYATPNN